MLLMLGLARRIAVLDAAVKAGNWSVRDGYLGAELRGKRLGVIGLGSIGRRVAALGQAFDMDVVYWSPSSRDEEFGRLELDELLATVRHRPAVRRPHSRDPPAAGCAGDWPLMRPSALLVNTARGALVDHEALIAAIAGGRLGGYATDVWEPEPPPPADLEVLGDRLLVTPHVAAITDVTYRDICVRTVDAAIAALANRPMGVSGTVRPRSTHRLR